MLGSGGACGRQAIDVLKGLWLVNEISGSRVSRFEHRLEKILAIPTQASALLTVLMLRGPQTAGELRLINTILPSPSRSS